MSDEGFGEVEGFLRAAKGSGDAGDDEFADAEIADDGRVVDIVGAVMGGDS